jgi:hypothetical protein
MTDEKPSQSQPEPKAQPADDRPDGEQYEDADIYTADMNCKCGRSIAANAWFCPQCGRPYLVNMLFALVVLATGFALLNQAVQYVIGLFSRIGGRTGG